MIFDNNFNDYQKFQSAIMALFMTVFDKFNAVEAKLINLKIIFIAESSHHKKQQAKHNPALNSDAKGFRSLALPPPFCAG